MAREAALDRSLFETHTVVYLIEKTIKNLKLEAVVATNQAGQK